MIRTLSLLVLLTSFVLPGCAGKISNVVNSSPTITTIEEGIAQSGLSIVEGVLLAKGLSSTSWEIQSITTAQTAINNIQPGQTIGEIIREDAMPALNSVIAMNDPNLTNDVNAVEDALELIGV